MSEPSTPTSSSSTPSLSSIETPPPPSTPPNLHQNTIDPEAKWLVQKYGGTSVGKFALQIAENIVPYACFSLLSNRAIKISCFLAVTTWTNTNSRLSARRVQVQLKRWAPPTFSSVPHPKLSGVHHRRLCRRRCLVQRRRSPTPLSSDALVQAPHQRRLLHFPSSALDHSAKQST